MHSATVAAMAGLAAPGLLGEAFEKHGLVSPARACGFFEEGLAGTVSLGKEVRDSIGFGVAASGDGALRGLD